MDSVFSQRRNPPTNVHGEIHATRDDTRDMPGPFRGTSGPRQARKLPRRRFFPVTSRSPAIGETGHISYSWTHQASNEDRTASESFCSDSRIAGPERRRGVSAQLTSARLLLMAVEPKRAPMTHHYLLY